MDKNKIKSFAIWARRNLISAVSERANRIGISESQIEEAVAVQGGFKLEGRDEIFKLSKEHRDKLATEVREKGFEQVMEEAAYTWFNRLMGLRYMEVNDYLPSGIRVLSSETEGKIEPDVLTRVTEVIEELELNAEYVYELLDSGKTEDREEAYKHILVKQCNKLGEIITQMFEKISDYTELLLPSNLLEEGSVIRKMVEDIEEEDWKEEVEIIGWMYQYYISEKKDEVFAALKKNVKITKENIPAATQLFTPKWIVKYMVENSLGRLWLEGHPNEELQKEWKYYLEEAQQEPEVEEELKKIREEHSKLKPEDIKVLDPCMGSGHILVYAFDVLYEIYKTAGYSEREIPRMILQNNLYGLDIDDRAAQLASFALIMKARHYNRRLFREMERESLELNLCSIQESNALTKEVVDYFVGNNEELRKDVEYLVEVFTDAKEYGSILDIKKVNFNLLEKRLREITYEDSLLFLDYKTIILEKLTLLIKQSKIIISKYDICITNPPYMGNKGMGTKLKKYLDKNYKDFQGDIYLVFMDIANSFVKKNGYLSMITMETWMFLSTYRKIRDVILDKYNITNLIHMPYDGKGRTSLGISFGTSAFVFRKASYSDYVGNYYCIRYYEIDENSEPVKFPIINERTNYLKQNVLDNVPDRALAYWGYDKLINKFGLDMNINTVATFKQGMATTDNDRFLRMWFEVSQSRFGLNVKCKEDYYKSDAIWFKYNKGGEFRKWFGNNKHVVRYEEDGKILIEMVRKKYPKISDPEFVIKNREWYFKKGITWSALSSYGFSGRICNEGGIFDSKGPMCFTDNENMYYLLGLLNSIVGKEYLKILAPTKDFNLSSLASIPLIIRNEYVGVINKYIYECVHISKNDWNLFEISWDFKVNPLCKLLEKCQQHKLEAVFSIWETECEDNFNQLKHNEEELNRIFIDIYGLQDELTPEVEDKDVTIRKADRERDIKSFISYAIGCMLGRYSIDAEGLIYAGGNFKDKWNLEEKKVRKIEKDEDGNVISDSWINATFLPDSDNVIPITEDEYFEDDIVARFIEFVRTVYGAETLEENLDFIADSIGRKSSETARQAIRRYFIKDFYKDHLKVYQKRPIYWMFESGKNDGFKALVYMHRYNEQTVAKVRTDYLHTLQRKYEAEVQRQQLIVDSEDYTAKDRTAAKKKIDRIAKQIEECREYDQVVGHLANEKIAIDLDDGVKVNYEKFQGVKVINAKGKEVKMDLLSKI